MRSKGCVGTSATAAGNRRACAEPPPTPRGARSPGYAAPRRWGEVGLVAAATTTSAAAWPLQACAGMSSRSSADVDCLVTRLSPTGGHPPSQGGEPRQKMRVPRAVAGLRHASGDGPGAIYRRESWTWASDVRSVQRSQQRATCLQMYPSGLSRRSTPLPKAHPGSVSVEGGGGGLAAVIALLPAEAHEAWEIHGAWKVLEAGIAPIGRKQSIPMTRWSNDEASSAVHWQPRGCIFRMAIH
jgi:hypothetical protein